LAFAERGAAMPDSAVGDLLGLASPDAPAPVATEESVKPERSATVRYLYHEPQLSSLCGVHALNNLLQGPYFGAGDLGEIAARVETREREILHDAALAERSASSGHVDANFGDFSIEVLSAALEGHGLRLLNIASSEVVVQIASSPEHEEGYLCHRGSHWFALRSIVGLWFNVDSRLERPRLLSDQELCDGVRSLRDGGHTVFAVRAAPVLDVLADDAQRVEGSEPARAGALPLPSQPHGGAGLETVWHPLEYVVAAAGTDGAVLAGSTLPSPLPNSGERE